MHGMDTRQGREALLVGAGSIMDLSGTPTRAFWASVARSRPAGTADSDAILAMFRLVALGQWLAFGAMMAVLVLSAVAFLLGHPIVGLTVLVPAQAALFGLSIRNERRYR